MVMPLLGCPASCAALGSRQLRVAGFIPERYFAEMCNIEARQHLYSMLTAAGELARKTAWFSTDDIECEFSLFSTKFKNKPSLSDVSGGRRG